MSELYQQTSDYDVITQLLGAMILSNDLHELRGAKLCAEYLKPEDAETRETTNLAYNVDILDMAARVSNSCYEDLIDPDDSWMSRLGLKISCKVLVSQRERYVGMALVSLAEYKHAQGEHVDYVRAMVDFSLPIYKTTGRFAHAAVKDKLRQNYRSTLAKTAEPLPNNRLVSAMAARQIYYEETSSLGFVFDELGMRRKFKRLTKHISKDKSYPVEQQG